MANTYSLSDRTLAADSPAQWHLLGAGSLGCLFAAYLQRAGVELELIVRDAATLRQLRANGGIMLSHAEMPSRDSNLSQDDKPRAAEHTTIAVAATTSTSVRAPIAQLLICTKAQQTLAAVAAIKSKIAPDVLIVLLQNGMGVREQLLRELPHATVLNALSTEGAFRRARFHVVHAGYGDTVIGAIQAQQHMLARNAVQALQCELPIAFAPDIERRLWLKLGVNSVINPLSAIHRCRNGELLELDDIDTTVTQLCDELAHVACAERIDLNTEQLRDETYRVMRATANNKSSMLQDIEARRDTEIDFINGFIMQRAHQHGIVCAQHALLLDKIRALRAGSPSP